MLDREKCSTVQKQRALIIQFLDRVITSQERILYTTEKDPDFKDFVSLNP